MTVERKCKNCGAAFTARKADVKRGWGLFHSKSCKASYQERRTHQYAGLKIRNRDDHDVGMEAVESGWDSHKGVF